MSDSKVTLGEQRVQDHQLQDDQLQDDATRVAPRADDAAEAPRAATDTGREARSGAGDRLGRESHAGFG